MQSMHPQEETHRRQEQSGSPGEEHFYQPQQAEQPYAGYEGHWNIEERGEKLRPSVQAPRSARRRHSPAWIIVIVVLGFIFLGGLGSAFSSQNANTFIMPPSKIDMPHKMLGQQMFKIGNNGTLHISGNYSTININHNDDANVIQLANQFGSNSGLSTSQTDNDVFLTSSSFGQSLTVNVPNSITLDISGVSGSVNINDVQGNINIKTDQGNVNMHGTSGQITVDTNGGSITMQDVALQGNSTLQTQNGIINFSGTLDSQGSYRMISNNGTVNVRLPGDAAFNLDARAGGGVNNEFGNTTVGSDPRPSLTIQSDKGSINIQKN